MEKQVHKVIILPAKFIEFVDNESVKIKILLDLDKTDERIMPEELIRHIKNPNYLLIGISTGTNHMQLDVCDGKTFKKIFEEKWSEL